MNVLDLQAKLGIDSSGYTKGLSNAQSAAKEFAKVGAAAFAMVGTATVAAGTAIVKGTSEVAEYGDSIDKMSQKIGISAEAYQEWDAVFQHSGASISVLQTGMKTLRNAMDNLGNSTGEAVVDQAKLQQAQLTYKNKLKDVEKAQISYNAAVAKSGKDSDAAQKALIDLEKAQNNAKIAASKVAQAAEGEKAKLSEAGRALLELGISAVDANGNLRDEEEVFSDVITALQNMNNETERARLATVLLGRGGTELGALLNTSAEDTQKMKDRVHELGGVMSDEAVKAAAAYQDQLQDMQTAIQGLKRNVLSDFMPTITKVMSSITEIASGNYTEGINQFTDGITEVVEKISDIMPKILSEIPNILKKIGNSLFANIGVLVPYISKTLSKIVGVISKLLPTIISTAVQLAQALIQALIEAIPIVVEAIPDVIKSILEGVESIVAVLPEWFDMIFKVIETLSEMLIDLAPIIIESALNIFEKVIDFMTTPEVLSKMAVLAVKVIANLAAALLAATPKLITGIGKIYAAVFNNIITTDWSEVGRKLIENITAALQKASNKLMGWWEDWSKTIGQYAVIAWNSVVDAFSGAGRWFEDRWHDIQNVFSAIPNWFGSVFSEAWKRVVDAFSPMGDNFIAIGNNILTGLKSMVNFLINGINDVIAVPFNGLNAAFDTVRKAPMFSWLPSITVPQIPTLAKGGVLKRGQMAFLEGQGDEAVIPLSQNTEWIDKIADKLSKKQPQYNININIDNISGDAEDAADRIVDVIISRLRGELASGAY